jgi:hypothetical protein
MATHDNQIGSPVPGRASNRRCHAALADDDLGVRVRRELAFGNLLQARRHGVDAAALPAGRIERTKGNGLFDDGQHDQAGSFPVGHGTGMP